MLSGSESFFANPKYNRLIYVATLEVSCS